MGGGLLSNVLFFSAALAVYSLSGWQESVAANGGLEKHRDE